MKKTLLLTLALIAVGCSDPIPRNMDGLVRQGDTYLDRETMRPHSGPVFRFFPNDTTQVLLSANLKDGKMDGPWERYYENGQVASKSIYVAGEQDGPYEYYYENGQLQGKGTYAAGEQDDLYESYAYYENGQLTRKSTFVTGELDGPYESYYENGQLTRKGTYNMGFPCGEWIEGDGTVTYDPCPPGLADGN